MATGQYWDYFCKCFSLQLKIDKEIHKGSNSMIEIGQEIKLKGYGGKELERRMGKFEDRERLPQT